jgi:hypothetical protein
MNLLISMIGLLISLNLWAHQIKGIQILKGAIKTKIIVQSVPSVCRVKVDKVKNLMKEDQFGNPAYKVFINVDLFGEDLKKNKRIEFNQDFLMNNLFETASGTEVRDLEYLSKEGAQLLIDDSGRILSGVFPTPFGKISCLFR